MMQTTLNGIPSASNVFVEDTETLNMVLGDALSDCLEDTSDKDCDDGGYADSMERSKVEHCSIGLLENLSFSDYNFHVRYTAHQSDKGQSTGGDSEVPARTGGGRSLAEYQTQVQYPEIVETDES